MMMYRLVILISALIATGCAATNPVSDSNTASQPSAAILQPPPGNPQLPTVRDNVASYQGQQVRWGGVITDVKNIGNATVLEVRAHPLDANGQPINSQPQGLFIVRSNGLLDNHLYAPGRAITVAGQVQGNQLSDAKGLYYLAPVIEAQDYYAWNQIERGYGTHAYGNTYDPFRRYGSHPYDRYFYPRFHFGVGFSKGDDWNVGPFGGISIGF